jgi:hypothetical protein
MAKINLEKIKRVNDNCLKIKHNEKNKGLENNFQKLYLIVSISIVFFLFVLFFSIYVSFQKNDFSNSIFFIFGTLTVLFLFVIILIPKIYVSSLRYSPKDSFDQEKEALKVEDDTRKTVAQIVGGAVLLGGLIFTYNTFRLQQDTYRLQQEGQFTDRFTKAITQIGDEKLEIRLGGLYALERIAKDSPKDHWTVMEVLSAYVRGRTQNKKEITLTTDIQTALDVIGRRKVEQDSKTDRINLTETNLSSINLGGYNFNRANFNLTNLSDSNLDSIVLTDTRLVGANLSRANLSRANLYSAFLNLADLSEADLSEADLSEADLSRANLETAQNITFEQLSKSIIDEATILPKNLANKKSELIEISKITLEKKTNRLKEIYNSNFNKNKNNNPTN